MSDLYRSYVPDKDFGDTYLLDRNSGTSQGGVAAAPGSLPSETPSDRNGPEPVRAGSGSIVYFAAMPWRAGIVSGHRRREAVLVRGLAGGHVPGGDGDPGRRPGPGLLQQAGLQRPGCGVDLLSGYLPKGGGSLDAWEIGKVRWANETYMSMGYTSMAQVRKAAELAEFAQERWDRDTMSVCPQVRDGEEQVPAELVAGIGADHLRISLHGLQSYMAFQAGKRRLSLFKDVSKGSVYYEAVMSAGSAGIVQGAGYNRFSPNIYISGIDAQTIISRTLDHVGQENRIFDFSEGDFS